MEKYRSFNIAAGNILNLIKAIGPWGTEWEKTILMAAFTLDYFFGY